METSGRLNIGGPHKGQRFSTKDRDWDDNDSDNCAGTLTFQKFLLHLTNIPCFFQCLSGTAKNGIPNAVQLVHHSAQPQDITFVSLCLHFYSSTTLFNKIQSTLRLKNYGLVYSSRVGSPPPYSNKQIQGHVLLESESFSLVSTSDFLLIVLVAV